MRAYLGVFMGTALVTAFTTPLVRRLAVRVKAIDYPSDRKVHSRPTPTIGGLAMLLGVIAGMGIAWLSPTLRPAFRFSSQLQGALLAGVEHICFLSSALVYTPPRECVGEDGPVGGGVPPYALVKLLQESRLRQWARRSARRHRRGRAAP